ncbi:hypothetical protein J2S34_002226 [Nitrobacter winogradskyi]|uniref:Uncharacterized protein n=1 Tax=Nitrobacter winogradskyi TaxID=913 RepID=A0ACC6AJ61_NITWI|nr:hypothetical protein [Nitrobacter winogradskyi]
MKAQHKAAAEVAPLLIRLRFNEVTDDGSDHQLFGVT